MFFTLYVDDILLARNNLEMIQAIKKLLSFVFEMKDMVKLGLSCAWK